MRARQTTARARFFFDMKIDYTPQGTCSRRIEVETDAAGVVTALRVHGGCSGNLQGISALCIGRPAADIRRVLGGIRCGNKTTSCPDQIARALAENGF